MSRFPAHASYSHRRSPNAHRAFFGAMLVLLSVGVAGSHGHGEANDLGDPSPVFSACDGVPGAPHGHTQGESLDCGICELSRRGDTDEASPAPLLSNLSLGERPTLRISAVNSPPRAPTRGRLSPRAPPASV